MATSAHRAPIIVRPDNSTLSLQRLYLASGMGSVDDRARRELFLQDLVHRCPEAIPMPEIEQGLAPMVSICTELPVGSASLDNLWMTRDGGIILGECKLVRNPQARREVLVQALDYASIMSGWSYEDFERAVGKRTGGGKLWDLVRGARGDDPDAEADFADAVQRRLREGQFLVLLILDGVQDGLETLSAYLQQHAGLHVNIAIVELSLWHGLDDGMLVVPRVPLKTQLIERGIVINGVGGAVRIVEPRSTQGQSLPKSYTASEAEFYDRLEQKVPGAKSRLQAFFTDVGEYGIEPEFQRSAILRWVRSPDQQGSLGYVDAYGAVWLGDGYYTARRFGNEAAGRAYVVEVASAIGGKVQWPVSENALVSVRGKSGRIARLEELLDQSAAWKQAISRLVKAFAKEDNVEPSPAMQQRKRLDDRKCLEVLAGFAPCFRAPGASFGTMGAARGSGAPGDPIIMPGFNHSGLAQDFLDAMYQWGWISTDFNYPEWMGTPEGEALRSSPEAIRAASADQLLKVMTVLLRGDHWMEGYLADCFEKGLLLAAAERAEAILAKGEPVSGTLQHFAWPQSLISQDSSGGEE